MKKHIIRILTVLLLVCLGAALFAACGETETPQKETYTVTYAAGGGTGTGPASEKYEEGATFKVKENSFTRDGYTFKTWNDGTKDYAAGATYTMPKKDVTFTAQWTEDGGKPEPAAKVTVTYSLGENTTGKAPAAQEVDKGGQVTLPAAPVWEGHTFKGWKVGSDATLKNAGDKITVNENVTVTAQWETAATPVEKVTVTFNLGDNTTGKVPAAQEVEKGKAYTLPAAPDWEGHLFTGWKVGETDEVKKAGETITPNADVTLTAQYKEVSHTITGATIEADEDNQAVYVTIIGSYTGYTEVEIATLLEDDDQNKLCVSICLGEDPWTYQELDFTVDADDDTHVFSVSLDVTDLEGSIPFFVCENRSGSGDIKTLSADINVSVTLGSKAYTLVNGKSSTLTLTVGEAGKEYAFTSMGLETATDKIYFVVNGTYTGYSDAEFKAALEDGDLKNLAIGINNQSNWQWPNCATTVTATDGAFTVKLDITEVEIGTYTVCENRSGVGDIKWNEAFAATATFNSKKYTIERQWAGGSEIKIEAATPEPPATKSFTVTGGAIAVESDKAVITLSGTFAGYTKEEFKAAIEDNDETEVGFRVIRAGGDWAKVAGPTSNEVGDNTFSVKIDVTALEVGGYYVNQQQGSNTDITSLTESYDITITVGEKTYQLVGTPGSNITLFVKAVTPAVEVTFSRPTSAKLELANDKGNGTDENFSKDIARAFFVISGSYTGEVTEAIAKEYFKFAAYPFEFGAYTSTKDRTRRISIDTEAHTYTVMFDVTWLPAGEHYCRFNAEGGDGDLRLSLEACPNNTVKSVGSTYTLTNYNGTDDHWGCIVLKVERNYAVTGADLEEVDGKANLVVNGTFDASAFTGEQIEKFLKDEDIRSMCVTVYPYLYPTDENYHVTIITTEGTFTVKLDLSVLTEPSYGILSDGSGYGDIKNVTVNKTLTVGNKVYTLTGTDGGNCTLTVAEIPKEYSVTTATIEQASEKINLVLSGTYAGYTDAEFTTYLQNVYYDIQHNDNLDKKGWDRLHSFARTASAAEGQWTFTIDITKLNVGSYGIHFDSTDGVGGENENTKNLQPTDTQLNDKTFNIGTKTFKFVYDSSSNKAEYFWGTLGVIVTDTNAATISFTKAQLTSDESHVYLVLTANVNGYTQQDLETMIYIGELDSMRVTVSEVTLAEGVATLKFDFTEQRPNGKWWWGHYMINGLESLNVVCPIDTGSDAKTVTVTVGGYKYTLRHNDEIAASENEQIIITIDPV